MAAVRSSRFALASRLAFACSTTSSSSLYNVPARGGAEKTAQSNVGEVGHGGSKHEQGINQTLGARHIISESVVSLVLRAVLGEAILKQVHLPVGTRCDGKVPKTRFLAPSLAYLMGRVHTTSTIVSTASVRCRRTVR